MKATVARLKALIPGLAKQRVFSYKRSDGSAFKLTMADIMGRTTAFEMAYNPNDCIEIRWAARVGSAEASTCKRRAPDAHRKLMESYRPWFKKRWTKFVPASIERTIFMLVT